MVSIHGSWCGKWKVCVSAAEVQWLSVLHVLFAEWSEGWSDVTAPSFASYICLIFYRELLFSRVLKPLFHSSFKTSLNFFLHMPYIPFLAYFPCFKKAGV
jgi:hypothetical protein